MENRYLKGALQKMPYRLNSVSVLGSGVIEARLRNVVEAHTVVHLRLASALSQKFDPGVTDR
jgi:hypothetical protein